MKKIQLFLVGLSISCLTMAQPPDVPAETGAGFGQKTSAENAISAATGCYNEK